jgi:hypothetical protein
VEDAWVSGQRIDGGSSPPGPSGRTSGDVLSEGTAEGTDAALSQVRDIEGKEKPRLSGAFDE